MGMETEQRFVVEPNEFVAWLRRQRDKALECSDKAAELRMEGNDTRYSPHEYELFAYTLNMVLDKVWGTGVSTEIPEPEPI